MRALALTPALGLALALALALTLTCRWLRIIMVRSSWVSSSASPASRAAASCRVADATALAA